MHDFIVKRAVDFVPILCCIHCAHLLKMRAIFTAVFRHAFYRRIFSPEVSGYLNCVAAAPLAWRSRAPLQPTPQAAWPRRVSTRSTVSRVSTRSTVSTVSDYERRRP